VNEVIKTRQLLGISQRTAALLAGVTEWRWKRWEKENAYEAMLLKFNQRKVNLGAADPRRRKYAAKWLQAVKQGVWPWGDEGGLFLGYARRAVYAFLEGRFDDLVDYMALLLYYRQDWYSDEAFLHIMEILKEANKCQKH